MAIITQETRIALSRHEALALGKLRGQVVECRAGELWLTVDGESQDVILRPGDRQAIASGGPVVVSAFAASVLSLRGA